MNLLYYHPIIMPVSSGGGGGGGLETKATLAALIVVNAVWLFCFIVAVIHTAIIRRKRKGGMYHYDRKLFGRDYLVLSSLLCGGIDIIAFLIGLACWVYSLL
jgi:hypothetical protein